METLGILESSSLVLVGLASWSGVVGSVEYGPLGVSVWQTLARTGLVD